MFGNRNGWILAGVVLGLMFLMLYWLAGENQASPPTEIGRKAATFSLDLPVNPRTLVNFMTEERDAGEQYRQALADYQGNRKLYRDFVANLRQYGKTSKNPNPQPAPEMPAVNQLLAARTARKAIIFSTLLDKVVKYRFTDEPVDDEPFTAILELGNTAVALGNVHQSNGRRDQARQCFEAAFALGVHLWEERLVWREADSGMVLFGIGADALAAMAKDDKQADLVEKFDKFRTEKLAFYRKNVGLREDRTPTVYKAIFKPNNIHTGDMLALARKAGEQTWRVEALMALGRCRFNADRQPDQRAADRVVREIRNDAGQPPAVRQAAAAAADLTPQRMQMMVIFETK